MNKFITLLAIFLLMASCSNNNRYEKGIESAAPAVDAVSDYDVISPEDAYSILISEKLQEYFEKQKIIKKHPDFDAIVTTKAPLLSIKDSIIDIAIIDKIPSPDFDSIALKTVVSYHNNAQKDTIISKIKRSRIVIEGEQIISSKVKFEVNKN